ncbi:MAG: hypothetical protein DI626_03265 [Micavibrio aeruginosavorus]|uniref:Uncharacterized protein n=1 Tax=Micavibrio aeruginosavorus TaxID=349221 RepID=A0A2W5BXG1_9BACT|nr:MAG: hypothetical protein DI626_03265 [Micavibrio aeruginosavorus]
MKNAVKIAGLFTGAAMLVAGGAAILKQGAENIDNYNNAHKSPDYVPVFIKRENATIGAPRTDDEIRILIQSLQPAPKR